MLQVYPTCQTIFFLLTVCVEVEDGVTSSSSSGTMGAVDYVCDPLSLQSENSEHQGKALLQDGLMVAFSTFRVTRW